MSRKKQNTPSDQEPPLTPWQIENQKYLKEQGKEIPWQEEEDENAENHEEAESSNETSESEMSEDSKEKDYQSFATKLPKMKKQRNKKLIRRLSVIVGVFLAGTAVAVYQVSPLSKLESVEISGNGVVNANQVLQVSKLQEGQPIWKQYYKRSVYEKNVVAQIPRVKTADIKLSGINTFQLKLTEFKVVAYEFEGGKYHPILENGFPLTDEEVAKPADGSLILEQFASNEKLISELIKQYDELDNNLRSLILNVKLTPSNSNPDLLTIAMKDKNEVKISIEDISTKMKYYPQVASQMEENGVVDMEVAIYSYPYSKVEEENDKGEKTEESSTLSSSDEEAISPETDE
ncbi:MAG: FtsQ-type POTRA domain-containing protein [Lactobacillales bacterium]|jgi:cell division protein FtsQ|nr:FtsQ-type POTRA domain-containing protein [Lactobacillales bacterium]